MSDLSQLQVVLLQNFPRADDSLLHLCLSAGWQVNRLPASAEIADQLDLSKFDLLIADLPQPLSSSTELIKQLNYNCPNKPLIIVSADATAEDVIQILRQGALDYLPVPVDQAALTNSVQRVLNKKRQCQESFKHLVNLTANFSYTSKELAEICEPELLIVDGLWRAGRITLESKLQICLAFQEALTNSLDHGNLELLSEWKDQFDKNGVDLYSQIRKQRLTDAHYASRRIDISFELCMQNLKISINDQGNGFDYMLKLPEDTVQNSKEPKCSGRGLTLIAGLMDLVSYSAGGRCIEMHKKIDN